MTTDPRTDPQTNPATANPRWDPSRYLAHADDRSRPFADLLARVPGSPRRVVDLGCGPGHLTALLRERWRHADVLGVDSSAEMVERARTLDDPLATYVEADVGDVDAWLPDEPVDLLISNATFQWVPEHRRLLPVLADLVAPGGTFAFSVPTNGDAPAHALLRELCGEPPYAEHVGDPDRDAMPTPADYLDDLARPGWSVDVWETTYTHLLHGPDPVWSWISGTGARPVLQALPDDLRPAFVAEYQRRLRAAYPEGPAGTSMPFRRGFAVATRVDGPPPRPVTALDHVQLACAAGEEDAARAFWVDLLDFREVVKPPVLAARGGAWFVRDRVVVHVGVEADFAPARKAHPAVALPATADVDELAARLVASGRPVTWDDAVPGVHRFHTTDGSGNRVEVQAVVG